MKSAYLILVLLPLLISCNESASIEKARNEIFQTEKAFEEMASGEGLAEAFYFFAADDAVILRGNDSIISGKENIRSYYVKNANPDASLSWTPDFIGVSDCGTLGYTYGRYVYAVTDSTGNKTERTGIFHTVWKKQKNDWRFVWD